MKQREAARAAAQPPTPDISALLRIINSQKQVPPPQPQPVAPIPAPTGLEAIFAQFANQKQQASQRQAPQFNLQAALASMSQPNQVQPEYVAPQQAQVPNLQALIASFGTQPTPQAPPMQGFGYPNQYQNQNGNERKRQYDNNDDEYGRKRSRGVGGPEKKVSRSMSPLT